MIDQLVQMHVSYGEGVRIIYLFIYFLILLVVGNGLQMR